MGYKLPAGHYANLYRFWGTAIADQVPPSGRIINLAANEYSRTVVTNVDPARVVTPKFLTVNPTSGQPTFIVVHAKVARGAFARWLVTARVSDNNLTAFNQIGYAYDEAMSTPSEPTFVCQEFGGQGLSVRLT